MKIIILTIFLSITYGCYNNRINEKFKDSFEGDFNNMITGYHLNCETVIQSLKIENGSFHYKRFCQSEPERVFDSATGFMRKTSNLSFLLLNKDSTKEYLLKILTDSSVKFILNPGQKNEFETELSRKVRNSK